MSNDSSNPYQSPGGESYQTSPDAAGSPLPPRDSVDYLGPLSQFFEHPQWVNNLLLPSLILIIPVLGAMVVWGYCFEVAAMLLTGRGERPYHGFNFDRFGDYLMRGLWIFLVSFLLGLILAIPIWIVMFAVNVAAISAEGSLRTFLSIFGFFLQFGMQIVVNLLVMPAMIRVGLTKEFGDGFNFGFMLDFLKRMWLDQVLVALFSMILGLVVSFLGILACCIGILPACVFLMFVMTMLYMQLYQVYLYRGGEVIRIAE